MKQLIAILLLCFSNVLFADTTTTSTTTQQSSTTSGTPDESTTTTTTTTQTKVADHDQQIVTAINDRFANDIVLSGTSLNVDSQNGIVTITGTVTMQSQADQAVSIAQSIPGVNSVTSQITVETNPNSPQ